MIKGLLADDENISFEAASMVRDALESRLHDRYTMEADPTDDALKQIEREQREEERLHRLRQEAARRDEERRRNQ